MRNRRSQFFWRLFASYCAVLVVTAATITLFITQRMEASLVASLEGSLRHGCHLLAPYAARALGEDAGSVELQPRLGELGRAAEVRITLIRPDGVVLGDSVEDPLGMENHGSRPEVQAARAGGFGTSERFSHTLGHFMLYVAMDLRDGEQEVGVVRLSVPLEVVEDQLGAMRGSVYLGTAIGFGVALLLGFFVARRTTRPIVELTKVAEEMGSGRYEARAAVHRDDEIGVLGESLNRLGAEATRRIASISQDDAQLRAMLAVMVEGVIAIDENDRTAFINEAAGLLIDVETRGAVGRSLWELAPISELEELVDRTRATSALCRAEIELFRTGDERVIDAHAAPFRGGGRSGLVVVLHDITDLRRLERVRRDFVANVSHELKTPLASIKGFVETLLSGALHDSEHNERFLQRIDANVDRLNDLVSDLLSLARIESQQRTLERTPVDWSGVIEEIRRAHEPVLERKGLRWVRRGTDGPVLVRGNPEAMRQVLDNLVDNAIKYTPPPGEITLELTVEDDTAILSVSDTGVGIPPEDSMRIFERFYRVDKARSRDVGGTGLGLSIVKHLVLSLGGDVSLESVLDQGSTFRVSLPLAQPEGARV